MAATTDSPFKFPWFWTNELDMPVHSLRMLALNSRHQACYFHSAELASLKYHILIHPTPYEKRSTHQYPRSSVWPERWENLADKITTWLGPWGVILVWSMFWCKCCGSNDYKHAQKEGSRPYTRSLHKLQNVKGLYAMDIRLNIILHTLQRFVMNLDKTDRILWILLSVYYPRPFQPWTKAIRMLAAFKIAGVVEKCSTFWAACYTPYNLCSNLIKCKPMLILFQGIKTI